jgi:hypothetical protein
MRSLKESSLFRYYKAPVSKKDFQPCCVSECMGEGLHKALSDPKVSTSIQWMCFDHVVEHNKALDYFKGMDTDAIEKELALDRVWRLSTRPIGLSRGGDLYGKASHAFQNFFSEDRGVSVPEIPESVKDALKILEVRFPISLQDLKKAYKVQVKKYHPDLNQGKKEAEETLKRINISYKILKDFLGQ